MTQYSEQERKAIANAFREAKKYLNKGDDGFKTNYICYALWDAMWSKKISLNSYTQAINIIHAHDDYWIRVVMIAWSATTRFTWRLPTIEEEALAKTHLLIQGL